MTKHGKNFRAATALIEPTKAYTPAEAIDLVKKVASAKFDETVELHLRTNADPRHAEQMVRGVAGLPHGLGKMVRVLAFAEGDPAREAIAAGADYVGSDDLVERIEGGWVEFDVALATPELMGKIGKLGRILGRKGLMPNPRTGTVVQPKDMGRAITEAKAGRVEFRMDRSAIIHCALGKASFDEKMLAENLTSLIDSINRQRPTTIKGLFVKSAYLTTTMGPSVPLDIATTMSLRTE